MYCSLSAFIPFLSPCSLMQWDSFFFSPTVFFFFLLEASCCISPSSSPSYVSQLCWQGQPWSWMLWQLLQRLTLEQKVKKKMSNCPQLSLLTMWQVSQLPRQNCWSRGHSKYYLMNTEVSIFHVLSATKNRHQLYAFSIPNLELSVGRKRNCSKELYWCDAFYKIFQIEL